MAKHSVNKFVPNENELVELFAKVESLILKIDSLLELALDSEIGCSSHRMVHDFFWVLSGFISETYCCLDKLGKHVMHLSSRSEL